jgi:hypothetical protein
MFFAALSSNAYFSAESNAQTIIGYSEAIVTVVDKEEGVCGSKTLEFTKVSVTDTRGDRDKIQVGSQMLIEASVSSNCDIANYPILIALEVRDSADNTKYFAFQNVTMSRDDETKVGLSWIADEKGEYQLYVFGHACLRCSGDFGVIRSQDFTVN